MSDYYTVLLKSLAHNDIHGFFVCVPVSTNHTLGFTEAFNMIENTLTKENGTLSDGNI